MEPMLALVGVLIIYWGYVVAKYLKEIRDELRKINTPEEE